VLREKTALNWCIDYSYAVRNKVEYRYKFPSRAVVICIGVMRASATTGVISPHLRARIRPLGRNHRLRTERVRVRNLNRGARLDCSDVDGFPPLTQSTMRSQSMVILGQNFRAATTVLSCGQSTIPTGLINYFDERR
jgi:hypothetical protein